MHSSDFRNTIVDLGFPFGSPVVENILVHCNLDTAGNINFQGLESIGFSFEFGVSMYNYEGDSHIATTGYNFIRSAIHFYL